MPSVLRRKNLIQNNQLDMQRTLNQLLKDAMERKPRRLSFDTTYSHDNIYDWLQKILKFSCSTFALSNWPAIGITRNVVKLGVDSGYRFCYQTAYHGKNSLKMAGNRLPTQAFVEKKLGNRLPSQDYEEKNSVTGYRVSRSSLLP